MRVVGESEVAAILTPAVTRDLMRRVLIAKARGEAAGPLRSVMRVPNGWFAVMPASLASGAAGLSGEAALGAKVIAAIPGNAERALPTHYATVVLFDAETGRPKAVVGGETITERRTAAISVVATERLAACPRGTLAILGAGVQGRAHLHAFLSAGLPSAINLWSRTPEHADALGREVYDAGVTLTLCDSAGRAVRDADVVVTATAAAEPLFGAHEVPDGAHLNAVGACVPDRRELPAALIAEANVYVDSFEGAAAEAGDLILAKRDLGDAAVRVHDELGTMLANPARHGAPARATIFKSLGLGIEDVACAAYVLRSIA